MPLTLAPAAPVQTGVETAIVREINRVRRQHGLRSVRSNRGLLRVARSHSLQMLAHDALSHDSFTGVSFTARLRGAGRHRRYGETLAWTPDGSASATAIVRLWLQSAPHRAVLLDGRLRRIGVARVAGVLGRQQGAAVTADWSS
jgi:uncharacterized protein YkwD